VLAHEINDLEKLRTIAGRIATATTIDDVRAACVRSR